VAAFNGRNKSSRGHGFNQQRQRSQVRRAAHFSPALQRWAGTRREPIRPGGTTPQDHRAATAEISSARKCGDAAHREPFRGTNSGIDHDSHCPGRKINWSAGDITRARMSKVLINEVNPEEAKIIASNTN